jgi:hypothetical protein
VARYALVYLAPILALMVGIFIVETTWIRLTSSILAFLLAAGMVSRIASLRR